MPEYLAPGVYIEERPGQRTIEGVATSTAGFVGMTQRGPVQGPPVLVTSFGDFQRAFGGYLPLVAENGMGVHGHLPLAVKQFFDNGGKRAFIARAYKPTGAGLTDASNFRATTLATGVVTRLRSTAPVGVDHAFVNSWRGFVANTSRIVRDGDPGSPSVAITALDASTLKAHVATLTEEYRADTAFVELAAPTLAPGAVKLVAREPGVWGENVRVQVRPALGAPVNTTAAVAGGASTVAVTSASSFYVGCTIQISSTALVGGVSQIGNVRYATVAGIAGNVLTLTALTTALPAYGTPSATWISLAEIEILVSWSTTVERFKGSWRYVDTAALPAGWSAAQATAFNTNRSVWSQLHRDSKLVMLDTTAAVLPAALFLTPYAEGDPLASHPTTADGAPASLAPQGAVQPGTPDASPGFPEYVGNAAAGPGMRDALSALGDEDGIALVAIPGITSAAVQNALITHAENLRYRFAVLDGPPSSDIAEIRSHRGQYDSKYAAVYYPWVEITDPVSGEPIYVPPSGSMLGVYARTDVERGVHKAPANEVVRNATDLEVRVTMGEQEVLNPEGINVIRDFRPSNRGLRVWGARTISSDPEWVYVNVRRLFIFIEHSIDEGTQWVVFEPNNPDLWGRVRRTIETFLEATWKTGALFGTKKDEAYYVKCDRSTMSQFDIDQGRLIVEIGIAPTKPAEFVIFRIGQFTAEATSN